MNAQTAIGGALAGTPQPLPPPPQQMQALTPDQLAQVAAMLQGKRVERPTKAELATMTPDQQEDALRSFYLDHDTDDPADIQWRHDYGKDKAIRDSEGRMHPWNIYLASDPQNEEVTLQEYEDYYVQYNADLVKGQRDAAERDARLKAEADEREVQKRVGAMQREANIQAEAERRFAEEQAAKAAKAKAAKPAQPKATVKQEQAPQA